MEMRKGLAAHHDHRQENAHLRQRKIREGDRWKVRGGNGNWRRGERNSAQRETRQRETHGEKDKTGEA